MKTRLPSYLKCIPNWLFQNRYLEFLAFYRVFLALLKILNSNNVQKSKQKQKHMEKSQK